MPLTRKLLVLCRALGMAACCGLSAARAEDRIKLDALETWVGRSRVSESRRLAPADQVIADTAAWKKLWTAWRPDEPLPEVGYARELVLVVTAPGPNRVFLSATLDTEGDVQLSVNATRIGGPGFGYAMARIARSRVRSIHGKPLPGGGGPTSEADAEDFIRVQMRGKLRTAVVAVGAETTGVTLSAGNVTWELDLARLPAEQRDVNRYNGTRVTVRGELQRREGVERPDRWIVVVTSLSAR